MTAIDIAALMRDAEAATGLSDWGDAHFREPLRILGDALDREAGLNAKGAAAMRERLYNTLRQRLLLIEDRKRYPEIAREPIARPIIVTGNGRSGTTLLHNLLSQIPGHRALQLWEMMRPSPPPEAASYGHDPRIAEIEALLTRDGYKSAESQKKHAFGAQRADECSTLLELAGVGGIYGAMAKVPSHSAYRESADTDFEPIYRFHRSVLQQLQWRGPKGRWVLKAPEHMFHLRELLQVYPDAQVVVIHRDPVKSMPSLISIVAQMRSLYTDRVDIDAIRESRMAYSRTMNALPAVRESLAREGRFFDVQYLDLHEDPLATLQKLCAQMGLEFDAASPAFSDYLANNPKGRFGEHRYRLADYGLSVADIDREFEAYLRLNRVRLERDAPI
jgi:hypothetical protein